MDLATYKHLLAWVIRQYPGAVDVQARVMLRMQMVAEDYPDLMNLGWSRVHQLAEQADPQITVMWKKHLRALD